MEGEPATWAQLDEITLGSTYPDLWVKAAAADLVPGGTVPISVTFGNRGGLTAGSGTLTVTLPAELTFVSSWPLPVSSGGPLVWDLGDLPGGTIANGLVITVSLTAGSASPAAYYPDIRIAGSLPEIELANNVASPAIFAGVRVYLPAVFKAWWR